VRPGRKAGGGRRQAAKPRSARSRRSPSPASRLPSPAFRIGHGYDIHRLEPGAGVTLGGVRIDCPYRVVAHSDGDVLIHALCDALLGAAGLGDIGRWFPDSDARFKDADSRELLRTVVRELRTRRWLPVNADVTLIAEAPRVAPHVMAMRERLAAELGVDAGAVNVKATTAEGLGAVGRGEGIAAHAVTVITRR